MRRLLALLALLCAPLPAQLFSPWNLQVFPPAVAYPARYQYRPAMVIAWVPQQGVLAFKMQPIGTQLNLVLRELLIVHPPTWKGTCAGFPSVGTRLVGNWGFLEVYPWQGTQVSIYRGLNVPLLTPNAYSVEHGTLLGRCPNSLPAIVAMLVEVTP